jgi:hypothetical protein
MASAAMTAAVTMEDGNEAEVAFTSIIADATE